MKSIFITLIAAAAITAAAAPTEKKSTEKKNAEKCVLCETRKEFALERYQYFVNAIKRAFKPEEKARFVQLEKAEKEYLANIKKAAEDHAAGNHK